MASQNTVTGARKVNMIKKKIEFILFTMRPFGFFFKIFFKKNTFIKF